MSTLSWGYITEKVIQAIHSPASVCMCVKVGASLQTFNINLFWSLKHNLCTCGREERKHKNKDEKTRTGREVLSIFSGIKQKSNTRSISLTAGIWKLTKCNQIVSLADTYYNSVCCSGCCDVRASCISDEPREMGVEKSHLDSRIPAVDILGPLSLLSLFSVFIYPSTFL